MKKKLHSKWTSLDIKNKEKHFVVVSVLNKSKVRIESVISKKQIDIEHKELEDETQWLRGWK